MEDDVEIVSQAILANSKAFYMESWTIGMRDRGYMGNKITYGRFFEPGEKDGAVQDVKSTIQARYNEMKQGNYRPRPEDFPVEQRNFGGGAQGSKQKDPNATFVTYKGERKKVYTRGGQKGIYVEGGFQSLQKLNIKLERTTENKKEEKTWGEL